MSQMIVTIDGPAGAGKSTVAKALARRLGFRFLDTGAMYRAVALAALERSLATDAAGQWAELARRLRIELVGERILVDGRNVSAEIRSSEVTAATQYAANNPQVRAHLVQLQKQAAGTDDIVTEGRDQGTVVFPQAACKIYLTATPEERAKRRAEQMAARGEPIDVDEVLAHQNRRDASDSTRAVGPLVAAPDAIEVPTDGLTPEAVIDRLEALVRERMPSDA